MLTHYERAFEFTGKYRSQAKKLFDKYGVKAYFMILQDMQASGDFSLLDRSSKSTGKADPAFYERRNPMLLASLNLAIMERSMTASPDPFAFHIVANGKDQLEFYDICMRSYKAQNPDLDTRQFYAMMLTGVVQTWTHLIHEHSGKKVYEITPGLAERLRHTELRGLKTEDLRLPYKSIYVSIPQFDKTSLRLYNEDTGWHNLEGFFLTEDLVGNNPSKPVRTWRFMFCGPSHDNSQPFDDALFHFSVELPDDHDLNDVLAKEQERVNSHIPLGDESRDIFRTEWRKLFDWALNVIMYMTWPDIEVDHWMANDEARALWNRISKLPKGKKKEELKSRFKSLEPMYRIRLGRNVPLWSSDEPHEVNDKVRLVKTLVSGFWMRQAYGEGRSLRRWRYQPPYWRNKDALEESNKIHVLV